MGKKKVVLPKKYFLLRARFKDDIEKENKLSNTQNKKYQTSEHSNLIR